MISGREYDSRDRSESRFTHAREAELRSMASEVSAHLPGGHELEIKSFDMTTGNPRIITSKSAPAEKGNYIRRALDHLWRIGPALGLDQTQPVELAVDPFYQSSSSGAVAVHVKQQYKGIPIFQAAQTVRFAPSGAIRDVAGTSVTVSRDLKASPTLSAQEATRQAVQYVSTPPAGGSEATSPGGDSSQKREELDLETYTPEVIAVFSDRPDSATILGAGPLGAAVKAQLVWFPRDVDARLAWDVLLTMPPQQGQYLVIVDAEDGGVLFCHQLVDSAASQGYVCQVSGEDAPLLVQFPDSWVAVDSTAGNSTIANLEDAAPIRGQVQSGVVTFKTVNPIGPSGVNLNSLDQAVLNSFYWSCRMHDYVYDLGFREVDGNFQQDNHGQGGVGGARVKVIIYPYAITDVASMSTPIDGASPLMELGAGGTAAYATHAALDSDIVYHEFMHGVTGRLVGGPLNATALFDPQSRSMGEGWSDYIACVINRRTVHAPWFYQNPNGGRHYNYSQYPHGFKDIGSGEYGISPTLMTPTGIRSMIRTLWVRFGVPRYSE